jgi:hypothetical protein
MTDVDRKHVRAVMTRMLNRQALTLEQLQDELAHLAAPNVIAEQMRALVRADLIVGVGGSNGYKGQATTYETWGNAVARLKDQPARLPRRCHAVRNPRRVA